ncbi:MAG TPA: L-fucose dehydrogenase [Planctomycetaceae bacterium]|nr:L-fucose dehydrogenase [Planctomycetaceae bacterium]
MLKLPPVVFGATNLGNLFTAIDDATKGEIIEQWLAAPVDRCVIDSAGKYGAGLSLETIGRHLERLDVNPDRVLISNKLGWRRIPLEGPEPTFEPGVWKDLQHDAVQDMGRDGILRCWEQGNQLLGKYSAGLLSVHDPDEYLAAATDAEDRKRRLTDIVDAYHALSELRESGEAEAIGVGCKTPAIVEELLEHCRFDWVMLANSFTLMKHTHDRIRLLDRLSERSIAVINSAVFHGGFLLGGDFLDYRAVNRTSAEHAEAIAWRESFLDVCHRFEVSPFVAGVVFGKSHPAITSVALSTSRPERVASHFEAATVELPKEFWEAMRFAGLIADDYQYL